VIVDGVDEVLTIEEHQIDQAPGAGATLIDATVDDRLVVPLNPSTIFGASLDAAA
jgi:chemotaxis signal transduction protein